MTFNVQTLKNQNPIISKMVNHEEIFWQNPDYQSDSSLPFTIDDIKDAEARLSRFSSYIKTVFPETKENNGKIESQIFSLDTFKNIEPEIGKATTPYLFQVL
ncbi:MAG TPA: D-serine ammonia-lyase, partial [Staphylococcus sp.]|nr:D-serine ammonia-lyase [Staphylococcus sp.]